MKLPVADIIEWDVLNWARLLTLWQPILDKLSKDARILAVGERNGGLSLWLALQGFRVECSDRLGPSSQAKDLHLKYGVSHLVTYTALDIVNGDIKEGQYDLIIAKSVIGGLKENPSDKTTRTFEVQQKAVSNIHRFLKPGGYFLSAENLTGSRLMQWYRARTGRDKGWRHLRTNDIPALFHPFSEVQLHTFGFVPTGFNSSFLNRLSYSFNSIISPILPNSAQYIAFTSARK